MKSLNTLVLVFLMGLGLTSCLEDQCDATWIYIQYEPVYVTNAEIRQPIELSAARELENPGKIYYYNDLLLINEFREGLHIIDNSDPLNPRPLSFIEIPGNVDMAIKDNVLYADNYVDLVALDISNPRNPVYAGRTEDVFPTLGYDDRLGHLIEFRPTEIQEEIPCNRAQGNFFWQEDVVFIRRGGAAQADFANSLSANASGSSPSSGGGTGIGGSLARFTISGNYMYTVSNFDLRIFDLQKPVSPRLANTVNLGWGIETIFPYDNKFFIGSNDAMYIYDNSNPLEPTRLGVFRHARACDPVFVEGDLAYVTLRDGTECENFSNQLDVVDVSNPREPSLLKTYPMHHPIGLSKANDQLFICEDDQGLKVFDASNWRDIDENLQDHIKGFQAYDVIAFPGEKLAIVVGKDGLYQFDFTNPEDVKQLSLLPVSRK